MQDTLPLTLLKLFQHFEFKSLPASLQAAEDEQEQAKRQRVAQRKAEQQQKKQQQALAAQAGAEAPSTAVAAKADPGLTAEAPATTEAASARLAEPLPAGAAKVSPRELRKRQRQAEKDAAQAKWQKLRESVNITASNVSHFSRWVLWTPSSCCCLVGGRLLVAVCWWSCVWTPLSCRCLVESEPRHCSCIWSSMLLGTNVVGLV